MNRPTAAIYRDFKTNNVQTFCFKSKALRGTVGALLRKICMYTYPTVQILLYLR